MEHGKVILNDGTEYTLVEIQCNPHEWQVRESGGRVIGWIQQENSDAHYTASVATFDKHHAFLEERDLHKFFSMRVDACAGIHEARETGC